MKLTITASSTALFSTWVFIEELDLLFDAGDGVSAALLQKSRKIKNIFISHADRDHVCGLLQLHQLNARDGVPAIHYPKDCGSFPPLCEFFSRFDPQSGPASWAGLEPDQKIELDNGYAVECIRSAHVVKEDQVKALAYTLSYTRKRLKQEFQGLPGKEIAGKKKILGEDAITERITEKILGYSGDSPDLNPADWNGVKILIHEATFLEPQTTRGGHANLQHVIEAAATLNLDALILMHFSSRYQVEEIAREIQQVANHYRPNFPIFALMPGVVQRDILNQSPLWAP